MIEKMRRDNEKLRERTRVFSAPRQDPELEMAIRLSEFEHPRAFNPSTGLSEAEIDVTPN